MTDPRDFFPDITLDKNLQIQEPTEAMIKHEVIFEKDLNSIRRHPLFLGLAFTGSRFVIAGVVAAVLLSCLVGRAAWMQVHDRDQYLQLAEANRLRNTPLWPRRGMIVDRHGKTLADNVSRFQVTMTPRDLASDRETLELEIGQAARILGLSMVDLQPLVDATGSDRDEAVLVADKVPYEQAMSLAVDLPEMPGFSLEVRPERRYPLSAEIPSLSHIIGYVGKISDEEYRAKKIQGYRRADEIGKTGIERSYETALRGTVGEQLTEVDVHNLVKGYVGEKPAVDGQGITLSIDVDLQRATEEALREGIKLAKVQRGAAVVMNPQNGEILAIASWPAYDNNLFSGGVSSTVFQALINNENQPMFPRAWAGAYPSGSTVKIVISVAALMENVITKSTTINSVGGIRIGSWFFPDWKAGGHGLTNVRKAIAQSVNSFYYMVGGGYESFVGLGIDRLTSWLRKFGLGSDTGVDLPNENAGFVPTPAWREERGEHWYVGDTYNLSIGQGDLLVTPLQVADYTSTIANGGYKIVPHLSMASSTENRGERLASSETIEVVRQGMRDGVISGSSRLLSTLPFATAGKTGTAQWRTDKNTHAWHTCFAPFDDPQVVVTVLLEEGGEGSSTAIPVSKKILEAWWKLKDALH